jgi:hypothetical protein
MRYRCSYPDLGVMGQAFVTAGLIYLHYQTFENWSSAWHTRLTVAVVYHLLNGFLAVIPFITPESSLNADRYPYHVFSIVSAGMMLSSDVYLAV